MNFEFASPRHLLAKERTVEKVFNTMAFTDT